MVVKNVSFLVLLILSLIFTTSTLAVTTPGFPICSSPQGTLKVEYSDGSHGIVGNTSEYKGTDRVYTLSDSTLLQCFCAENGDGIQTNWWKASSLSEDEIEILKRQGWYYIENGALWGLSNEPYLAINSSYSCRGEGGIGGPAGEVLGASTTALAGTGNSKILYTLGLVGIVSLIIGLQRRNA